MGQRTPPGYAPISVKVGGFTVLPSAILGLGFDSNVLGVKNGPSDVYGTATLAALARSDWARHSLSLLASTTGRTYASNTHEDGITYRASATGRLEASRELDFGTEVSREHLIADRDSIEEITFTRDAVRYDRTVAGLNANARSGLFESRISVAATRYDFQNSRNAFGQVIDMQQRDFTQLVIKGNFGYQIFPTRAVYAGVDTDQRRYRLSSPANRDSDGVEVIAGIRGALTPLIRGNLGLRYIILDFKDPAFATRKRLGLDADLTWLITELTTINFSARQGLRNVSRPTSPGVISTRFALSADHELLRNLILSGGLSHERGDYVGSNLRSGLSRASLGANWLLNRQLRAGAEVNFRIRTTGNVLTDNDYSAVGAMVSLGWRL